MSKVVSISGGSLPEPGVPTESVVKHLEQLLEKARAGEIIGVATVQAYQDRACSYSIVGFTNGYSTLGAAQSMIHDLTRGVLVGDE